MPTKIEWTHGQGYIGETWNPLTGCAYASEECLRCYAAREAAGRLSHTPAYKGLAVKIEGEPAAFTGEIRLLRERLSQPLHWRAPRMIFVNSMSDLFHKDVPEEFIANVFATMLDADWHIYQVLTKRPQRMADVLSNPDFVTQVLDWARASQRARNAKPRSIDLVWPAPHVWLGTSIGLDKYTFRADHLRRTPTAVPFLSLEPLLGPLPSLNLDGIRWVIVGGESGPGARPMHPAWARDIRLRCDNAGVPFFFKQWGEWSPYAPLVDGVYQMHGAHVLASDGTLYAPGDLDYPDGPRRGEAMRSNHDRADLTAIYRVGKKNAGRLLDDHTWDAYPDTERTA